MKWTEFNRRLGDASDKMRAIFTDRLTTDFVDADFISDVKIGPTENLFNYDPDKKAVWYEFACDLKGEPWYVYLMHKLTWGKHMYYAK